MTILCCRRGATRLPEDAADGKATWNQRREGGTWMNKFDPMHFF